MLENPKVTNPKMPTDPTTDTATCSCGSPQAQEVDLKLRGQGLQVLPTKAQIQTKTEAAAPAQAPRGTQALGKTTEEASVNVRAIDPCSTPTHYLQVLSALGYFYT